MNIYSLLLCNIQLFLFVIFFFAQTIHFNTDLWTRENKTAQFTKYDRKNKRNTDVQTVQRSDPAFHRLSANSSCPPPPLREEEGGRGVTVDSKNWSATCAISATDPVRSDQRLKLDSAPTALQKKTTNKQKKIYSKYI